MSNLYIFYGDNLAISRNAFTDKIKTFKQQGYEAIYLSKKDIDEKLVDNILYTNSLLGENRLIAVDNMLNNLVKSYSPDIFKNLINSNHAVIIWHAGDIDKSIKNKIPAKANVRQFFLPKNLFKFLESVKPGNQSESLYLLKSLKDSVEGEFIFLMLVRQIRYLLMAKGESLANLQGWQAGKIKHQADKFKTNDLLLLYKKLLTIDNQQKTSGLCLPLFSTIELLILEI